MLPRTIVPATDSYNVHAIQRCLVTFGAMSIEHFDVLIVGAGPAGFSASLAAMSKKLRFVTLEQDSLGGCVFQWSDGWWKYKQTENLDVHDTNASWPDGGLQAESIHGSVTPPLPDGGQDHDLDG